MPNINYRYKPPYAKYFCVGALLILAIPILVLLRTIVPVAILMLIEGDTY